MQLSNTESELIEQMSKCYQFENVNMLEHGQAVHTAYLQLIEQLEGGEIIIDLPPLVQAIYDKFKLKLEDADTIRKYQIYHDCGKHLCRTVDEDGKQRFPNHAYYSALQYTNVFGVSVGSILVIRDMDFHTMKGDELIDLCRQPLAITLYLTAWAEIIANSKMFGGYDSTSFKIKRKALIQAGKKFQMEK